MLGKVRRCLDCLTSNFLTCAWLSRHKGALRTSMLDLHDSASANIYCTHAAGAVITPEAMRLFGNRFQLQRGLRSSRRC